MEKLFNEISIWIGFLGGCLAWLLGGWDALLITLLVLVCLDYITGLLKAIYLRQLSSEIGYKGIIKKVLVFMIVVAASSVQIATGNVVPLREPVILFFAANEAISLLENAAQMGLTIPDKLKTFLLQLREKPTVKKESEEKQ